MSKASKTVLIVDDDPNFLKYVLEILADTDIELVTVGSGEMALEVLAGTHIDAVVSDTNMRGMSGLELLTEIKKKFPKIPVVQLFNGLATDLSVTRHDVLKLGAQDVMTKEEADLRLLPSLHLLLQPPSKRKK